MPKQSMLHLNGNLLCVIDTETTGLKAGFHDVIEVCIIPLDCNIQPLKELNGKPLMPFMVELQPKRPNNIDPEALSVNKKTLVEIMGRGLDPWYAADLFEKWWEDLKLPFGKRITPLGQNYAFDRGFLVDWLGDENYNQFFHYHYRDTCVAAGFMNDRADFHAEVYPFQKINLQYLCSTLKVERQRAHTAVSDCLATAEVYRRMCMV